MKKINTYGDYTKQEIEAMIDAPGFNETMKRAQELMNREMQEMIKSADAQITSKS